MMFSPRSAKYIKTMMIVPIKGHNPSLLMAFSSITAALSLSYPTKCDKSSKTSIPPRFGSIIPSNLLSVQKRLIHGAKINKLDFSSNVPLDRNARKDCVMCKKFSQGPCGKLFLNWLTCIDNNNSNESICDKQLSPLDECLKKHEEYYANVDAYAEEGEENYRTNWEEFILNLESGDEKEVKFEDFPTIRKPLLQFRPQKMLGTIEFHQEVRDKQLILGYAKDDKGNILAAASSEELLESDKLYCLRFNAIENTTSVIVSAVYMDLNDSNDIVLYRHVERLPSVTK